MTILRRGTTAILAALLLIAPAAAQTPTLSLEGKVKQPQHWMLSDLRKMQAQHAVISYQTDCGPANASLTGVLLWSLIELAGGIDDTTRNAVARHSIRVTASDGYVVVLSTAEIAPDLGAQQALIAYDRDGQPLNNFCLVMPDDKHDARDVHDVVTIAVE